MAIVPARRVACLLCRLVFDKGMGGAAARAALFSPGNHAYAADRAVSTE
jgi:hypothetical protein